MGQKIFAAQTPQRKRITHTFSRFSPVLSGNRLYYSKCNFILTLFYGEKSSYEDKLSKSRSRDYSPLDNPPTWRILPTTTNYASEISKNPRFALSLKLCCKIAARQARGWGWVLSGICLSQIQLLCHVTLRSA